MNRLYEDFRTIQNLAPHPRGKKFEKIIGLILNNENIRYKLAYRPDGEEIDGAFIWNSHTFLLEAKWHKDPIPASSIYMFKGKVDGKFSGTRGIFISMSGYSGDCQKAVSVGKDLNILLFDRSDIETIVGSENEPGIDFTRVLTEKIFAAGHIGEIYLPWKELLQNQRIEKKSVYLYLSGLIDYMIISSLINHLHDHEHLATENIELICPDGEASIPSLIQLLPQDAHDDTAILIILNTSSSYQCNRQETMQKFAYVQQSLPSTWKYHLTIASPDLTWWIGACAKPGVEIATWISQVEETSKIIDWNLQMAKIKEIKETVSFLRSVLPRIPGYP